VSIGNVGGVGAPAYSQLSQFVGTVPDADLETICSGANRLTLQVTNQAIYITFGVGPQGAVRYDLKPELYLPVTGQIARPFDAFKVRAFTPAAQLPAGATQAFASLTPRQ
jgi:hypothetical protein